MSMNDVNPRQCVDCGQDAYIRLAGTDDSVCAHCFADRGRALWRSPSSEPKTPRGTPSPPPGSAEGAAR